MNELLRRPEYQITFREVLPIKSFTAGIVPAQELWEGEDDYVRLGDMPLIPIKIASADAYVIYAGIAVPINGKDISALSHFGAPNKAYGYDSEDFITDEFALRNPTTPKEEKRKFDHSQITNWAVFERIRARVTNAITAYREGFVTPPTLTPIIQFRNEGSKLSMDFDLHMALSSHVAPSPWETGVPPLDSYLSELGPLLVAAYSPDITKYWPKYDTYPGGCISKNPMGATQFIPYSLGKADELVAGQFARTFIHYCETGKLLVSNKSEVETSLPPYPDEPYFDDDSSNLVW